MQHEAEVRLSIGPGLYGTSYGTLRGEVAADIKIAFKDEFCSLHPNRGLHRNNNERYCMECREVEQVALFNYFKGIQNAIPCTALRHEHECKCYLGHDCDNDPCDPQNRLRLARELGQDVEMMALAAEAPSKAMLGVYERLSDLEKDNQDLRNLVSLLISLLPEDTREALDRTATVLPAESNASD